MRDASSSSSSARSSSSSASPSPAPQRRQLISVGKQNQAKRKRFSFIAAKSTSESTTNSAPSTSSSNPSSHPAASLNLAPTQWLSSNQIEDYLTPRNHKANYLLPFPLATSLVEKGECKLYKRLLSNYKFVYGPVLKPSPNHWMALFINIPARVFIFLDPVGTSSWRKNAFANWLKYVEKRADLRALHADKPFREITVEHPKQKDAHNCGIFVIKFLTMLHNNQRIHSDSFTQDDIEKLRASL
jgi:hypothetical protein